MRGSVAERSTRAKRTRVRVAVVDDHRLVRDGVAAYLSARRSEFAVVVAVDSWSGLLEHGDFPVDVVVLDLNLGDGIPVAAKIRVLAEAGSRTIVMSRQADPTSIRGALAAGAFSFVPKTESAHELAEAVRAAARGETHIPDAVLLAIGDGGDAQDPGLGRQELRAMMLYAAGRSIREVAEEMTTTEETVKSYIKRARRKYRSIGVDLGTKVLLRRRGIREGWLSSD
ncbi:MAG: hypothetical protein RI885_926 [Actinomycetota bacterium]|jgi:DNA-binding NarL/FixJ family response regulator